MRTCKICESKLLEFETTDICNSCRRKIEKTPEYSHCCKCGRRLWIGNITGYCKYHYIITADPDMTANLISSSTTFFSKKTYSSDRDLDFTSIRTSNYHK